MCPECRHNQPSSGRAGHTSLEKQSIHTAGQDDASGFEIHWVWSSWKPAGRDTRGADGNRHRNSDEWGVRRVANLLDKPRAQVHGCSLRRSVSSAYSVPRLALSAVISVMSSSTTSLTCKT